MKRTLKQTIALSTAVVLAAAALAPAASAAGTATLSFSPSSGTFAKGSVLAVGVYEDSGSDTVNAVQANFSYPSSLLSCYGSSPIASSSAFGVDAQDVCSGGTVKIGRGAMTAVSSSQLIATVSFQVIASGTAALTFDTSTSKVVRSTDHQSEALAVQNASYTLTTPSSPSPSPSPSGGTTTGSKSGTSAPSKSGSTTTKTTSPPSAAPATLTISGVAVSDVSSGSATITWQTNLPASSVVEYGPSTSYGLTVVDNQLTTQHSLKLTSQNLRPSLVYHFAVKSVAANGQSAISNDKTFETTADGSLQFGQPAANPPYLAIALSAVGAIVIIALGLAWHIHRLHAAAASFESHVVHSPSGTAALSDKDILIAPHHPPSDNDPFNGPTPPPVG